MKCPYMFSNKMLEDCRCLGQACAWWRKYRDEEYCGMCPSNSYLVDAVEADNYMKAKNPLEIEMLQETVQKGRAERTYRNGLIEEIVRAVKGAIREELV